MRARIGVIALLVLFFSPSVWAAGAGNFEKGIQAFRRGDYAQAVSRFEAARSAGMHSAQLLYNLGVSYYKLGQYDEARRYFLLLTDDPSMGSLARYNLAIVATRQGRRDDAIKLLQQVTAQSKDLKLKYLARAKLAELRADTGVWRGFISVRGGYNDNVNVAPNGTPAGPDGFVSIFAHLESLTHGTWSDGLYIAGNFFTRKYLALSGYDQDVLQGELRRETRWGTVPAWYGAFASTSSFGGAPYQNIFGAQAAATWPWGAHARLKVRYRFADIHSLNPTYDYLQGWYQQLRLQRDSGTGKYNLRLRYELELNDRLDQSGASFSPTTNRVSIQYRRNVGNRWSARGNLAYGISDYPSVGTQNRHDHRADLALSISRLFQEDMKIRLRYLFVDNQSTDAAYTYRSNQVDAGLVVYF
jgi:predicted negative regulator of RcsB-dependent stress response